MIEQHRDEICYLQFAHLTQFPEIAHGAFTRLGGYSTAATWGLNASFHDENPEHVLHNRLRALQALGVEQNPCATVWQIHSADVATLEPETWDDWRTDWAHRSYMVDGHELIWTAKPRRKADAIITNLRNVTIALAFADCVPIVLYDPIQHVIGIAHAGWRGAARGIAVATIEAMQAQFDCQPQNIYAGIAPSIGPCCYETTPFVQSLFLGCEQFSDVPTAERYRGTVRESAVFKTIDEPETGHSRLHLDLWQTNRNQLLMAGLHPDHIELPGICTGCNTHLFFSHRKEHGNTGRFPVLLALSDTNNN